MRVVVYKDDLKPIEDRLRALEIELKKLLAAVKRSKARKKKAS